MSELTPSSSTDEILTQDIPVEGDFIDFADEEWEDYSSRSIDGLDVNMLRNRKTGKFMISIMDLKKGEYFSFTPQNEDINWAFYHPQIARDKYKTKQFSALSPNEADTEGAYPAAEDSHIGLGEN